MYASNNAKRIIWFQYNEVHLCQSFQNCWKVNLYSTGLYNTHMLLVGQYIILRITDVYYSIKDWSFWVQC